jgi:hypothetical protein
LCLLGVAERPLSGETGVAETTWNMLPTKVLISPLLSNPCSDLLCPLCTTCDDHGPSLFELHFCLRGLERILLASQLSSSGHLLPDRLISIILNLSKLLVIPLVEHHLFQIFAVVTCDLLWFSRN